MITCKTNYFLELFLIGTLSQDIEGVLVEVKFLFKNSGPYTLGGLGRKKAIKDTITLIN